MIKHLVIGLIAYREKTIRAMFAVGDSVGAASNSAEFELAALMGRRGGNTQCLKVYGRCHYPGQQLLDIFNNGVL